MSEPRHQSVMRSVPVGMNFIVLPQDDESTVYVKIPEMVLRLNGATFIVNCIYERRKDDWTKPEQFCDYIESNSVVEYWWPV
jgi:hypothetical protein